MISNYLRKQNNKQRTAITNILTNDGTPLSLHNYHKIASSFHFNDSVLDDIYFFSMTGSSSNSNDSLKRHHFAIDDEDQDDLKAMVRKLSTSISLLEKNQQTRMYSDNNVNMEVMRDISLSKSHIHHLSNDPQYKSLPTYLRMHKCKELAEGIDETNLRPENSLKPHERIEIALKDRWLKFEEKDKTTTSFLWEVIDLSIKSNIFSMNRDSNTNNSFRGGGRGGRRGN